MRWIVGAALAGVALGGGGCFPSDPGCEFEEPCPEGQVRQCINFCARVAATEEVDSGSVFCALDPCADLYSVASVCPEGYFCAPTAGGGDMLGRCQPDGPDFGASCGGREGDVHPACAEGTFCLDAACPRGQAWTQLTGITSEFGFCLDPVREGGLCDSNWLDARADPRNAFEGGCAPCEPGTVCALSEGGQRRCIRLCEENTLGFPLPSPELCACQGQTCEDRGETFDPDTGERVGRFFCSECTVNRTRECSAAAECCDPLARCFEYDDSRNVLRTDCCRGRGVQCDPTSTRDCCGDSYCDPNTFTCAACARLGDEVANAPCCPGLEPIVMVEGQPPVCQACGFFDDKFLCSNQSLVIRGQELVESVPIPNTNLSYREVVGHVSGDLDVTRDDVRQIEWNLTDDHRAFFFDTRLSNGVHEGDRYFSLPFNDPAGTPRTESIADPDSWRSVRVYDSGDCSLLLGWDQLSGILGTEINQALLGDSELLEQLGIDLTSLDYVETTPQLQASSRYPIEFPLGPEDPADRITLRFEARIAPVLPVTPGCRELSLVVEAIVRTEPAIEPSSPLDSLFENVGCELSDDVIDPEYICMLPAQEGDVWTLRRAIIPRLPYDQIELARCRDECIETEGCADLPPLDAIDCEDECQRDCQARGPVEFPLDEFDAHRNDVFVTLAECFRARDQYKCIRIPDIRRADEGIEGLYRDNRLRFREMFDVPREVTTIDGATDIALRPGRIHIDIDGGRRECRIQDAIARGFEINVEAELWTFAEGLTASLRAAIGAAVDPRRIAVRPDGFEIILAEDPRDPQRGVIASTLLGSRACAPGRSERRVGDEFFNSSLEDVRTLASGRATFDHDYCEPDDVNCLGICADLGASCANNQYEVLTGIPFSSPPRGARCTLGECCLPTRVCEGQCRDFDTDSENCGGCGVTCPEGQMCAEGSCCAETVCDGACVDTDSDPSNCGVCGGACAAADICCSGACKSISRDPEHCGGCGIACDAGESCVDGTCV